jgi:hypothetical protein
MAHLLDRWAGGRAQPQVEVLLLPVGVVWRRSLPSLPIPPLILRVLALPPTHRLPHHAPGTGSPEDVMELDRELTSSDSNERALKRLRSRARISDSAAAAAVGAVADSAPTAGPAAGAPSPSPAASPLPPDSVAVAIREGIEDSAAAGSSFSAADTEEVSEQMVAPKWWSTVGGGKEGLPAGHGWATAAAQGG